MKKNYGFTLIELLGVIIILGIITTITVPMITNQLNESKKKLCITQYENILNAARAYGADHLDNMPTYVTYDKLVSGGYIKEGIQNPITKEQISSDLRINITKIGTNRKVKYSYSLDREIEIICSE